MEYTAKVHGVTMPDMRWHCMMKKYAAFWGAPNRYGYSDPAWQKLEDACAQQGVVFEQNHRALGDALATAALIRRLAELRDAAQRCSETEEEWDFDSAYSCDCKGDASLTAWIKDKELTLELSELKVTLKDFEAEQFALWLLFHLKPRRH